MTDDGLVAVQLKKPFRDRTVSVEIPADSSCSSSGIYAKVSAMPLWTLRGKSWTYSGKNEGRARLSLASTIVIIALACARESGKHSAVADSGEGAGSGVRANAPMIRADASSSTVADAAAHDATDMLGAGIAPARSTTKVKAAKRANSGNSRSKNCPGDTRPPGGSAEEIEVGWTTARVLERAGKPMSCDRNHWVYETGIPTGPGTRYTITIDQGLVIAISHYSFSCRY